MKHILVWTAIIALLNSVAVASAAPHYLVNATLDQAHGALAASVDITVPADSAKAGAGFIIGGVYKISSITASDNATATLQDTNKPFPGLQRIFIQTKSGMGGDVHLNVSYSGILLPGDDPPLNAISSERIELSADSLWYPLEDNFSTRFTLDASIDGLPANLVIASPDQVHLRAGGFDLQRSLPRPDIAFYAAPNLNTAKYGELEFVGRHLETDAAMQYRVNGPKALAFEEKWFGPLPAAKAVVAIIERKSPVGYSRPGYIAIADIGLIYDPKNIWANAGYLAHELSHSWWSNANFMSEDYWLVESTAEYSALRFLEKEYGREAIQGFLDKKQPRALRGGPILGHGRPSDDAVYGKGPLLLYDLDKTIGRDKLDPLLAGLAQRDSITTKDFLDALAAVAGIAVAADFKAKLLS